MDIKIKVKRFRLNDGSCINIKDEFVIKNVNADFDTEKAYDYVETALMNHLEFEYEQVIGIRCRTTEIS